MSRSIVFTALAATLLASAAALAQAPAGAPAGATGICKDGSYATTATKKGACRGHKGVQDWYAATGASAEAAPAPAPAATGGSRKHGGRKSASDDAAPAAVAAPAAAAASATASAPPAGASGQCRDGTYSSGATKKGACRGHKGVKDWYSATAPAAAAPAAAAPAASAPVTAARMPAAPVAAAPSATATKATYTPAATAAPGGAAGLVWANKESKVYHCQGDRWYGKTKEGAYLSEADAKAQGYRADHGKACQN